MSNHTQHRRGVSVLVLLLCFALSALAAEAQGKGKMKEYGEDAILDMPDPSKPPERTATPADPNLLLPLPGHKEAGSEVEEPDDEPSGSGEGPILALPKGPKQPKTPGIDVAPLPLGGPDPVSTPRPRAAGAPTHEFPTLTVPAVDPTLPPPPPPPAQGGTAVAPAGGDLPVMPKDTSSAVFMVMKSWETGDTDLKGFLTNAVQTYGKEAEDSFRIAGLEALPDTKVALKEDDVTLDELLDAVAARTGIDWGVDIPQKTLYVYPKKMQ